MNNKTYKFIKCFTGFLLALSAETGDFTVPVYADSSGTNDTVIIDYRNTSDSTSSGSFTEKNAQNTSQTGTLTVTIAPDEKSVDKSGIKLSVSKIADANYTLTDNYKKTNINLQHLKTAEEVSEAVKTFEENYQTSSKITEITTDASGQAKAEKLEQGVYLVKAEDLGNFAEITSFLVSVPSFYESEGTSSDTESEEPVFDISVLPKYKLKTDDSKKENDGNNGSDTTNAKKNAPDTAADIKTKQYTVVGIIMIILGSLFIFIQKKSEKHKTLE